MPTGRAPGFEVTRRSGGKTGGHGDRFERVSWNQWTPAARSCLSSGVGGPHGRPALVTLTKKHPAALDELTGWYKVARKAEWTQLEDVRKDFRTADQIGEALVFDIAWNDLRLITTIEYTSKRIFVKALLTHKEYDRKEWMRWAKH